MVEVYVPTSEAKALAAAADRFLSDQWGGDSVRAMLDEPSQSVPLAGAVEDMGWTSLTVEDEMGGGGADVATACLLLERLGRQLAPPAVAPALLAARVLADLTDPDVRKGLL
ncbi:acyl-CoA dehydrogenase family protein, partial [Sporichthya polymorpha]|uniref:acyl-CoA dehydrogenase family protein n=1 Tax=Sporichthya polymorpha TaxID=35751 RepID=UPI00035E8E95